MSKKGLEEDDASIVAVMGSVAGGGSGQAA